MTVEILLLEPSLQLQAQWRSVIASVAKQKKNRPKKSGSLSIRVNQCSLVNVPKQPVGSSKYIYSTLGGNIGAVACLLSIGVE